MARPFDSTLGHLLRRKVSKNPTRVWKTGRKPFRPPPVRRCLDACTAPLWTIQSVSGRTVKVVYTKPDKTKGCFALKQTIVVLEYFKGQTLTFVRTRDRVKDLRDDSTMSVREFCEFASAKIGQPFAFREF